MAKFGGEALHNTWNVIRVEKGFHHRISGLYSSINTNITGSSSMSVREWLRTQSFEAQANFGRTAYQNLQNGIW